MNEKKVNVYIPTEKREKFFLEDKFDNNLYDKLKQREVLDSPIIVLYNDFDSKNKKSISKLQYIADGFTLESSLNDYISEYQEVMEIFQENPNKFGQDFSIPEPEKNLETKLNPRSLARRMNVSLNPKTTSNFQSIPIYSNQIIDLLNNDLTNETYEVLEEKYGYDLTKKFL